MQVQLSEIILRNAFRNDAIKNPNCESEKRKKLERQEFILRKGLVRFHVAAVEKRREKNNTRRQQHVAVKPWCSCDFYSN